MSPIEFYSETIQKARKQYECECCGKIITVGEVYARRSPSCFGDLTNRKLCIACNDAVNVFCSQTDKDFIYSDIKAVV